MQSNVLKVRLQSTQLKAAQQFLSSFHEFSFFLHCVDKSSLTVDTIKSSTTISVVVSRDFFLSFLLHCVDKSSLTIDTIRNLSNIDEFPLFVVRGRFFDSQNFFDLFDSLQGLECFKKSFRSWPRTFHWLCIKNHTPIRPFFWLFRRFF